MLKKQLFALFVFTGLLLSVATVSRATTVERLTLEDLAARSRAIVHATVRNSRSQWDANRRLILTTTTVDVSESLKGSPGSTMEITTIGGRVGDTVLHVAGMPVFTPGEDTILFVEQTGVHLTVLGMGQGKFKVANGEVMNSVSDLSFPDGRPGRAYRMPVQSFKNEIRSIVGRQR